MRVSPLEQHFASRTRVLTLTRDSRSYTYPGTRVHTHCPRCTFLTPRDAHSPHLPETRVHTLIRGRSLHYQCTFHYPRTFAHTRTCSPPPRLAFLVSRTLCSPPVWFIPLEDARSPAAEMRVPSPLENALILHASGTRVSPASGLAFRTYPDAFLTLTEDARSATRTRYRPPRTRVLTYRGRAIHHLFDDAHSPFTRAFLTLIRDAFATTGRVPYTIEDAVLHAEGRAIGLHHLESYFVNKTHRK
ncbi:hypothetical protein AVEN_217291-1 [Araneus ventricosus]|uniref:Uncharacterized protein n=1 Tax=Araneus ventricosus TaxID=182803 RepID=A0A4Y2WQ39_ARAVE|nr:hypothetical protein AVEN_217291-1 [Araneus ventricosus]